MDTKERTKENFKRWCKANLEYNRERAKQWGRSNREHVKKKTEQWRKANPEYNKEYAKRWREINPELNRERNKRWREVNPEYSKERVKQWRKINPARANELNIRGHNKRRALVDNNGSFTLKEWQAKLIKYNYSCAYCGINEVKLVRDHYIPLSKGGRNDIKNIRPACKSCNASKHNQWPLVWLKNRNLARQIV